MYSGACSSDTKRHGLPMITPISASAVTRSDWGGSSIVSPQPIIVLSHFMNDAGSVGKGAFRSAA